jgi:hypothetical protein
MAKLIDKFNCINATKRDDNLILDNLENYFENYLQNNNKVILYEYMTQVLYFNPKIINSPQLNKIIFNQLESYIVSVRNNMRTSIKKNLFNLDSGLNKFFVDFKIKVNFINSFTNSYICEDWITSLLDIIINDIYIKNYIEQNITNGDTVIKVYLTLLKYNCNVLNAFIKILADIHKKHITIRSDYPIPVNIKRLYDFKNTLKKMLEITDRYKNVPTLSYKLNLYIKEVIINDFIDIITNNSVSEINIFIKETDAELSYILYNDKAKSKLIDKINNGIVINELQLNILEINDIIYILNFIKLNNNDSSVVIKVSYNKLLERIANIPDLINKLFDMVDKNMANYMDTMKMNISLLIINILEHYKNKDEMIKNYYKSLLKRLLYNFNTITDHIIFNRYLDSETKLFSPFIIRLSTLLYPIKKIISDFRESFQIKDKLKKSNSLLYPINIPLISNNMEINVSDGVIPANIIENPTTQLTQELYKVQTCYNQQYKNTKSISWLAHFGEVNIIYINKAIKLLPIQMLILELFNEIDFRTKNDLLTSPYLQNYSQDFKFKILDSFVKGNLLIRVNNTYFLNNETNFSDDLISIFHSLLNSNQKVIEHKELVHLRQEITMTNINSLLKINKYNYSDISKKLKEQIKLFVLDDKIIDESLKIMLDKDYIIFNTDTSLFEKIYY